MAGSNCCFLTCTQISQEAGEVVWYSHLFKNFPQFVVIHTVKGFGIVNEAEVDVFLEFSRFSMIQQTLSIWSLVPLPFLYPVWTSEYSWFVLKPSLMDFEHYFDHMWNKCNCAVVWTLFGISLIWDWNENWPFPVLWPLLRFPNLPAYWVQLTTSSFRIWNSPTGIPSPPLSLFIVMLPKAFIMLRYVLIISSELRVFNLEWLLDFFKMFFCIYWDSHVILSFVFLMWY